VRRRHAPLAASAAPSGAAGGAACPCWRDCCAARELAAAARRDWSSRLRVRPSRFVLSIHCEAPVWCWLWQAAALRGRRARARARPGRGRAARRGRARRCGVIARARCAKAHEQVTAAARRRCCAGARAPDAVTC
jgi:hypothetical protein